MTNLELAQIITTDMFFFCFFYVMLFGYVIYFITVRLYIAPATALGIESNGPLLHPTWPLAFKLPPSSFHLLEKKAE